MKKIFGIRIYSLFIPEMLLILTDRCRKDDVPVPNSVPYASSAAGSEHSLALKTDGTLWAWGANDRGQLGDGTKANKTKPVQIGSGFAVIAAGDRYSLGMQARA